ncbi:MAG: phosphoribosylformylglycinamidine synthase subunit PurL [Rhodobacteraceae bacterium]|nr:phosphoribosylformylglycinamidine synthase subunit PurL [Paracoccaceae bacterium]
MRQEPEITDEVVRDHGLNSTEYQRVLEMLGRTPSFTELGIISAMWNEHCSYKSSRKWLRLLPTTGPRVIRGPGENAGVVDIGDGQAVVFKMESHNHPSYIEPFQGAATGVGGILRDVFAMGARPIAAMNSLSFGSPDHPKTKSLLSGVVEGIGSYGNCFGVPTVGGEVRFHRAYDGNCLVNAFAAGLVETDSIFYSAASNAGRPVVYLGARTGRDGVGGSSMASSEFDSAESGSRSTVQVGDPFTEKRLLEACLELMATGAVNAIQDMGAAGLTCSAVEMGDKGGLGVRLDLEQVPVREEGMTAYEMMLSESQERMLMVMNPGHDEIARKIFEKWDLEFATIGETITDDRFVVAREGKVEADLPLSALSREAPEYDRETRATPPQPPLVEIPEISPVLALKSLLSTPNLASRHWVYQQYDSSVMADTVRPPGFGAAVVRVHGTNKALAFTSDVTPRYCAADPEVGGKQAVAEAYRNLTAVGAVPIACTDCLNFGNPENPAIMGQFAGCIAGISEACTALDMPVVSGNVSFYNETDGEAILPTPTIGAVGLIDRLDTLIGTRAVDGDTAILVGETRGHLGQSALLAEVFHREEGPPPPVDLHAERVHGDFVRACKSLIHAATDLSDGGLALAGFELAERSGIGLTLDSGSPGWYFGEDQGRYLFAVSPEDAPRLLAEADGIDVSAREVGRFCGRTFRCGDDAIAMEELEDVFRTAFERLGEPGRAQSWTTK